MYSLRIRFACFLLLGFLICILLSIVTLRVSTAVSGSRSAPCELVVNVRSADLCVDVLLIACLIAVAGSIWSTGCSREASQPYKAVARALVRMEWALFLKVMGSRPICLTILVLTFNLVLSVAA